MHCSGALFKPSFSSGSFGAMTTTLWRKEPFPDIQSNHPMTQLQLFPRLLFLVTEIRDWSCPPAAPCEELWTLMSLLQAEQTSAMCPGHVLHSLSAQTGYPLPLSPETQIKCEANRRWKHTREYFVAQGLVHSPALMWALLHSYVKETKLVHCFPLSTLRPFSR